MIQLMMIMMMNMDSKKYISNNLKPVDEFTMKSDEFNVDHVYDIVTGLCYNVYRINNNKNIIALD